MKKIFENQYAEIHDISEETPQTVLVYWKGYLMKDTQEAITACEESLKYFKEASILVMISDCKNLEGMSVEFLDWVHEYYFPTCVKYGLKAEIVLDSEYLMGNISLDLMYDEEDMNKNLHESGLYTPKIDTLENAKLLAKKIVEQNL